MACRRIKEEEEQSSSFLGTVFKTVVAASAAAATGYLAYNAIKEVKAEEAKQYCSSNKLNIKIIYGADDQADILCSMEATNIEVSLVFSPVFILESPEYAHVALKFTFNQHGRDSTVFIAGVCSEKAHVLEPEVSFKSPTNIFETIKCGRIFMAPYALMRMCENNPSNHTTYDIYENNCYVWALNYGLMAGDECGQKIVSIIKRLRNSQNKFIVRIGDIGHLLQLPTMSNSSSLNSSF